MDETNRILRPPRELCSAFTRRFCNASRTARAAGHKARLHVEADLLRSYFLPEHPDDDGVALVGALLEAIYAALQERHSAIRIGYGKWLGMYFEFWAQHRRKPHPEPIPLQVLLGPCTSNRITIYVVFGVRHLPVDDTPF